MTSKIFRFAVASMAAAAVPAFAYVGPGAGLGLLGTLWGLVVAVAVAVGYVVLWPLRRWRRGGRKSAEAAADPARPDGKRAPASAGPSSETALK